MLQGRDTKTKRKKYQLTPFRCHTNTSKYIEHYKTAKETSELLSKAMDKISAVISTSSRLLLETGGFSGVMNDVRVSGQCVTCGYFIEILSKSIAFDTGGNGSVLIRIIT